MQIKKQQLKPDVEQWAGSKLGKEYVKAVYCHPVYLMYMQSTSCKMLGWMEHKLDRKSTRLNSSHTRPSSFLLGSVQFSSVTQSCPTLCDPMNCSTPGLPVHHQLPEFNQTHVHQVSDAIQPSHPLSSPSPPAPNPSQHQSLFQ